MNRLTQRNPYPGKLFVVEGVDGSGKSTQLDLLRRWLVAEDYDVFFTEWNSSPLVKKANKKGKKKNLLTPTTFSILHATDFADRCANTIIPPLQAGMIVLADRYVFTAFARDVARGVHPIWVRNLYSFAVKPDIAFYFKVPIDVSIKRITTGRQNLKFYEAGMDLGLSDDPVTSFRMFQSGVLGEYDRLTDEYGLTVVDGTEAIDKQQEELRAIVHKELEDYNRYHRPMSIRELHNEAATQDALPRTS